MVKRWKLLSPINPWTANRNALKTIRADLPEKLLVLLHQLQLKQRRAWIGSKIAQFRFSELPSR